jgi:uncharacterized protein (TIGR02679 family)
MSSPAEQLALLATPAFARLWKQARAVLERTGGSIGAAAIVLSAPTQDERIAVSGLLGRHRHSTKSLRVRLGELDRLLRAGPTGKGLVAILEHLGGPLRDRRAEAEREEASARRVLEEARAVSRAEEPWFVTWLDELVADGTLTRLVRDGRLELIPTAARIHDRLPADGVPLPVFAGSMTSDTKALDSGTLATVVLRGLALRADRPRPLRAADRRALWDAFGVVADDLSSQVLVLNMPARATSALGEWLQAAGRDGVPFRITLHQLTTYKPQFQPARVWVCENPAVLRAAAGRFGQRCDAMVCGEGRPSTAFRRLVAALNDVGCELAYHGDFDWPGIRIANAFFAQHGGVAWRMTASDYVDALQRVEGDEPTALTGRPETASWDPALEPTMRERNRVVFEEMVLETLLSDLARDAGTDRAAGITQMRTQP